MFIIFSIGLNADLIKLSETFISYVSFKRLLYISFKIILNLKEMSREFKDNTIEISDKAIRASSSSAGAFVNLLNAEMEGLLRASSYNFGRMLYGDGSGKLATIASNTANQVVVDSVLNLMEGDIAFPMINKQTKRRFF